MILFSGEKCSALMPQNGVQIRIVQFAPILASGNLCLLGFPATDKKSYCMAAKPAESGFFGQGRKIALQTGRFMLYERLFLLTIYYYKE